MEDVHIINVRSNNQERIRRARYYGVKIRRYSTPIRGLLPYHNCREQRVEKCSGTKWQSILKTLISSLLAVAALKYDGKDPFEAKPIVTWCFLLSFFLYCLTLLLGLSFKNSSQIFSRMALGFGAFSSLFLLSLFIPITSPN